MENEIERKFDVPQCYVVVRKLTMEEISRISLNPLYIVHKCGRCRNRIHYGPQCATCKVFYHRKCAISRKSCCGNRIFLQGKTRQRSNCPKCKIPVEFGPQCSLCKAKYHHYCISQFEQCCQLNLYERERATSECRKCGLLVDFGPKCPLCMEMYHVDCVGEVMQCCGVRFTQDDNCNYKCVRCQRRLGLGSPMCSFCGNLVHGCCSRALKNCCGKPFSLELYFIPNFKFVMKYYMQFDKRRAALKKIQETVVNHSHKLRSRGRLSPIERAKKKSVSSQTTALDSSATQTNVLDNITIVDVKTELEQKELDIVDSPPPVLEREDLMMTPELSSSSSLMPDNCVESEDTLKNLFDFLYNMVKKFPPPLQTQVKIDLFKTVTEAEMKWQCNMVQNNFL